MTSFLLELDNLRQVPYALQQSNKSPQQKRRTDIDTPHRTVHMSA
jgi:hypothetical protein